MKLVNIILILGLLVSCSGKKKDTSLSLNIISLGALSANYFSAGMMIYGKNNSSSYEFAKEVPPGTTNIEFPLEKGNYEFLVLTWDGGSGKFSGDAYCGYVNGVELDDDETTIDIDISKANCTIPLIDGDNLSPNPYGSASLPEVRFRTCKTGSVLNIPINDITYCTGEARQGGVGSLKVTLRTFDGQNNYNGGIESACINNLDATGISFPTGSAGVEFLAVSVDYYINNTDCSGSPTTIHYENGLFNPVNANESLVMDDGTTPDVLYHAIDDSGLLLRSIMGQINITAASGNEYVYGSVFDSSGNIYILGNATTGPGFGGSAAVGTTDTFIIKINSQTGLLDSQFGDDGTDDDGIFQFGLPSYDVKGRGIAIDSSGDLYVVGNTNGSYGGTNAGADDAFIAKIDSTNGGFVTTFGFGDGGPSDGIVQINANNTTSATGTENFYEIGINSSDDIFILGKSNSNISDGSGGGYDAVVIKLSNTGGNLDGSFGDDDGTDNDGIRQFNIAGSTANDSCDQIAFDGSGSVYIAGTSNGNFSGSSAGGQDVFVAKFNESSGALDSSFDSDGIVHFDNVNGGSASGEYPTGLAYDAGGDQLYISGYTQGSMSGSIGGSMDGFIIKINGATGVTDSSFGDGDGGTGDGILQFNGSYLSDSSGQDNINNIFYSSSTSSLLVIGSTMSSFSGVNAGSFDAFVAILDDNYGNLYTGFGSGDGADNDGILQINSTVATGTSNADTVVTGGFSSGSGHLFFAGATGGNLSGTNAGSNDVFFGILDLSYLGL